MIERLINEYLACAESAVVDDYANEDMVSEFNEKSDRMRSIVSEAVSIGQYAIDDFISVLDIQSAAVWAAHHLVEMADLDRQTLEKCFAIVKEAKLQAEAKGNMADAMGEEMWLKEWAAKKL